MPKTASILSSIAVLALLVGTASADQRKRWFELSEDNAWLQNLDPTLVSRRLHTGFKFEDYDGDKDLTKIETQMRWGVPITDDLAFRLQIEIPAIWSDTATSSTSGIGDLELRTGIIRRVSPTLRYGVGLHSIFDTASHSSLGDNAFILRPIAAIRWDASSNINLGLNVEYSFTPRDEGADDVSALELKHQVAVKLNDDWSAAAVYKPRWNFLSEKDRHRLGLSVTRIWGADRQFAFSLGGEVPLTDDSLDYKLISGFNWSF